MRILVACELPQSARDELEGLGVDLRYEPGLTPERLRAAVPGVSVLVYDTLRIGPEVIERGDALQMLLHAGPGPGDIAVEAASHAGIFISNCPTQHAAAVAELTLGLILALDRRIVDQTLALREGRWARGELLDARGLAGRTLGILGYGPAGRAVAQMARCLRMRVLAWNPTAIPEAGTEHGVALRAWPRELAREADIITIQSFEGAAPSLVIDAEFLQNMQPGAYLIHVGASGVVDESALAKAIEERQLRVALDAYGSEPAADTGRIRSRLLELPGVIGTQHAAEHSEQARRAIAEEVVRIVRSFLVSGEVLNCLNLLERSPATWQLFIRARDVVGVMASVLDVVRADGINVEEITSRVFLGARAAWCTVALDERPSNETVDAIRALEGVLYCELRAVL